jgi:ABC-type uncharacterized transport system substrate-binding protein
MIRLHALFPAALLTVLAALTPPPVQAHPHNFVDVMRTPPVNDQLRLVELCAPDL